MSQPIDHHFLPQWYLDRWTTERVVWEFRRQGPTGDISKKYRFTAATAYKPHLYSLPGLPLEEAVTIERDFLQHIDDRAAKALRKLELGGGITPSENVWLVAFICSMLHRSPGRIQYLQDMLRSELSSSELFKGASDNYFRHYGLRVFADLVKSKVINERIGSFRAYAIDIGIDGFELLTSDRPLILSDGLGHSEAFVALPVGPRRLLFLSERRAVADRFANRTARRLSRSINDAIVCQAEALVISRTGREVDFVNRRLGKTRVALAGPYQEGIGLVRWQI